MNEKARKYIDLFRKVKIATAATIDKEGQYTLIKGSEQQENATVMNT